MTEPTKHIFLTGVTGALGSSLAPVLLADRNVVLHVLIRAESDKLCEERLQSLIDFWAEDISQEARNRIKVYRGDASLHQFGLSDEVYLSLLDIITHLVHSAASVKLDMSLDEATKCVYTPSKRMMEFATALHSKGCLRKFEYISTLGVAGKMRGLIPEGELPEREFHNTYESTKSRSEAEVLASFRETGLPVTIHRPSMIIGDSKTGKIIHFQGFYFLCRFLSGRNTRGFLPDIREQTFDLIPCDYVALTVASSLYAGKSTTGCIFHLCSGPEYAVPYRDLALYVNSYFDGRVSPLPRLKFIPAQLFITILKLLAFLSRDEKQRKQVSGLSLYYKHAKTLQSFGNVKTCSYLSSKNLPCPPHYKTYLDVVLGYYVSSKK